MRYTWLTFDRSSTVLCVWALFFSSLSRKLLKFCCYHSRLDEHITQPPTTTTTTNTTLMVLLKFVLAIKQTKCPLAWDMSFNTFFFFKFSGRTQFPLVFIIFNPFDEHNIWTQLVIGRPQDLTYTLNKRAFISS